MAKLIQKAKKSSIYLLIGKISGHAASIIITWLLIKKLSLEDYGIYNLLLATATCLSIVSSMGFVPTLKRYLPEYFHKKEYPQFLWIVKFGLAFRAVAAILCVSIILLLFDKIGPFFQIGDYYNYFFIFAIGLVFLLQARSLQHVLQAMFLHKYVVYAEIIHALTRLLLLYFIFYLGYGLLQVLIVDSITHIVLLGLCFSYYGLNNVQKKGQEKQHHNFPKSNLLKRLFRYSVFSFFNEVGKGFIDISADFFVISHYLGSLALGYYAFAARIGRIISAWIPSKLMSRVIVPTYFARYAESGDKRDLDKMFRFLSKLNGFLLFPVFTLVGVFGREIIQYVFDPKYLTVYPVMVILLIHYMALLFPVAMPLQAVEKPEMVLIAKLASVYNLIMDIILIQFWGIIGVAIATSSAIVLKKIFEYIMSRRYAGITFPLIDVLKILLNCFAIGALGIWVRQYIDNIFSLLSICILLSIVYLCISYFNKVFVEEERNLINSIIGKPYCVF